MIRSLLILGLSASVFAGGCKLISGGDAFTPEFEAKQAEEKRHKEAGERSLFARFDEFVSMKAPLKPAKLSGPTTGIVVLTKMPGGEWEMEGWVKEPDGTNRRCLESAGCKGRHPLVTLDSFRATSGEEAKTLVRITCDKGAAVKDFEKGVVRGTVYASDCLVEVFDLSGKTMLGSKRIKADRLGTIGNTDIISSLDVLAPKPPVKDYLINPFKQINEYLDTFGNI